MTVQNKQCDWCGKPEPEHFADTQNRFNSTPGGGYFCSAGCRHAFQKRERKEGADHAVGQ